MPRVDMSGWKSKASEVIRDYKLSWQIKIWHRQDRFSTLQSCRSFITPGETLDEKLQEMGMGVKEFATRVSKPEKTIIAVLKGKSSITPDMAVAFEMVTKNTCAHVASPSKKSYDEFIARKKKRKTLKDGLRWAKKFPYAEILKSRLVFGYK